MTESTISAPRRGVPIWVQIIIWVFLVGLLAIVAVGLKRAQEGTVQPGAAIDDFTLTLFEGSEYNGQSQIKLSDLRGKVVVVKFLGFMVQALRTGSCRTASRLAGI